jgi:hypothetical protein
MSADEKKNGLSDLDRLMKQIGAKRFDPIPPDHYLWMMGENQPPDIRFEGWMLAHTIAYPRRSPYAVNKEGQEQHAEHAAADLRWEIHNARSYIRRNIERGFCRMGTEAEGPRRIYLCGSVRQIKPAAKTAGVCTNPYPDYKWKKINELPESDRLEFLAGEAADLQLQKDIHAELLAAQRIIFDQRHDTRCERFALPNIRQIHKSNLTPAEIAARNARISLIIPAIDQVIDEFVQTPATSVQTPENGVYKAPENTVQTAPADATLLPGEIRENSESVRASSPTSGQHGRSAPQHNNDGLMHDQDHTPKPAKRPTPSGQTQTRKPAQGDASDEKISAYLATHKPPDNRQAEILFSGIPELQKRWPRAPFAQKKFSHLGAGDKKLTSMILEALEGDDAGEFLESVDRRCEKGNVGSVGMFLELAREFHRAAPDRARRKAEWEAEEARQAAFTETARKREEAFYTRLLEHPEECPFCKGTGLRDLADDRGRKWKGPCVCPAGEKAEAKTA